MTQKLGLSFVVFWLVITAAFALILVQHMRDIGFKYPKKEYTDRLPQAKPGLTVVRTGEFNAGALKVIETLYSDNSKSSSVTVNGTPLDSPTKISVENINSHIAMLSEKKDEENTTAIILDVLGVVSSLFSAAVAFYEWKKTRNVATR